MSNHDIQLPARLAAGTKGGPGFRTKLLDSDSGAEARPTAWGPTQSRIEYDISKAVSSREDVADILSMYRATRGAACGWRFKDLTDWSTSRNHNVLPELAHPLDRSIMDPPITDGVTRAFQLQKIYVDPSNSVAHIRKITRPTKPADPDYLLVFYLNGSPFWANGLSLLPGLHVAVDYDTGLTYWDLDTIGPIPGPLLIEAAFTFHVPSRFDLETDRGLRISWDEADQFSLDALGVTEIQPDHHTGAEEHLLGGQQDIVLNSNPYTVGNQAGHVMRMTGAVPGQVLNMPNRTLFSEYYTGGPWAIIENDSANAIAVRDCFGTTASCSIAAGAVGELYWIGPGATEGWKIL